MRSLTSTLLAAQKQSAVTPYVRVEARNEITGVVRYDWSRLYTGSEDDYFHAVTMPGDGSLIRVRITPPSDSRKLYRQRVADPDPQSDFSQWVYINQYNAVVVACCSLGAEVSIFWIKSDRKIYQLKSTDYGVNWGSPQLLDYAPTTAIYGLTAAYKPNGGLEKRFEKEAETEEGVWDFIRTHLKYLPTFKGKAGQAEFIPERDPRILFDQLIAFYVRHGIPVPISSPEFQTGLSQRFLERDGMYFLAQQAAEYDKKRMLVKDFMEMKLFVDDEASAIQWLRQQLKKKPQTYQEIQPEFMQQISGWKKTEQTLELAKLLEDNFLKYDGNGEVPSQIHSYLSTDYHDLRKLPKDDPILKTKAKDRWYVPDANKEADLEKKREKALLREFEEYRQSKQKKLKIFRLEAVRAGFKKAWQDRDYQTIIDVAEKIPDATLQEDNKLLMWYDQAITRTGGEL